MRGQPHLQGQGQPLRGRGPAGSPLSGSRPLFECLLCVCARVFIFRLTAPRSRAALRSGSDASLSAPGPAGASNTLRGLRCGPEAAPSDALGREGPQWGRALEPRGLLRGPRPGQGGGGRKGGRNRDLKPNRKPAPQKKAYHCERGKGGSVPGTRGRKKDCKSGMEAAGQLQAGAEAGGWGLMARGRGPGAGGWKPAAWGTPPRPLRARGSRGPSRPMHTESRQVQERAGPRRRPASSRHTPGGDAGR